MSPRRRRTSRLRKAALQLLLVLGVFAAAEGVLRVCGFAPPPDDADPFVGFARLPLFVPDPDDPAGMVTAPNKRNLFNVQRFAKDKPDDVTRVFCLGGSTTYGRPYTDAVSFPGWLRELLPAADPSRRWEVVNAGGVSYASYRVAAVLDELCAYEPDLFVIYTGHNEFLEERTYSGVRDVPGPILRLGALLRRSALFTALRRLVTVDPGADDGPGDGTHRFELGQEVSTLLDKSVGPDAYTRDDVLQEQVVEHFRFNLGRMLARAAEAGARVLLVTPACELADCRPFKSEFDPGLEADVRDALAAVLADPGAPLADLERASARSPRHAGLAFRLGEALLEQGRVAEARQALVRARDEDVVPLRAITPLVEAVREAARAPDVLSVDALELADTLAREHTGVPVPGREVFLDHVHWTIEGDRRVALAIVDALADGGLLLPAPDWRDALPEITARVEASLSEEDRVRALARLAAVLDWARKRDEAEQLTDEALRLSGGGDAMSWWAKGNFHLGREEWDDAIAAYEQALVVDPGYTEAHQNLAAALLRVGRPQDALAHVAEAERLGGVTARSAFTRGAALGELQRDDESRAALEECLRLDPSQADAHNLLGLAALRDGRLAEAETHLLAARDAAPDEARPRYNLGRLRELQERDGDAEALYREALAREPDYVPALARLGQLLARTGRIDEALAQLSRAADLRPDDASLAGAVAKLRAAGARLP
ncbi:MAG: tetratricopeptide repeat protein [Planctomycetes bacterium]|nr:tetratricopeptide repeat protein [Planctomycetota bacterium]